jgi:hypothetical protein
MSFPKDLAHLRPCFMHLFTCHIRIYGLYLRDGVLHSRLSRTMSAAPGGISTSKYCLCFSWCSVTRHGQKTDCFKIRLNSKDNFSAFSETEFSKIVNTWSKWYSTTRVPGGGPWTYVTISLLRQLNLCIPTLSRSVTSGFDSLWLSSFGIRPDNTIAWFCDLS